MDASEKWMITLFTPYQTTNQPKWMLSKKTFVKIILAAYWSLRHSSTSSNQQRRPLPSLLTLSFFYCTSGTTGRLAQITMFSRNKPHARKI